MFVEAKYSGDRKYGNSNSARSYTLTVSQNRHGYLSITFNFKPRVRGQNKAWDSDSWVTGGKIRLPKRQARALASAILTFCQSSENEPDLEPLVLPIDEQDLLSKMTPTITVQELAEILQLEEQDVVQLAKKYQAHGVASTGIHLPAKVVQKIQKERSKKV